MRTDFARLGIAALLLAGSGGCIAMPPLPGDSQADVPADVRAFVDTRDACDHWRGEPVPEPEADPQDVRKKQIVDAINESCTGTDKRLSALKAKYTGDPHVMQLLDEYDVDIEADD